MSLPSRSVHKYTDTEGRDAHRRGCCRGRRGRRRRRLSARGARERRRRRAGLRYWSTQHLHLGFFFRVTCSTCEASPGPAAVTRPTSTVAVFWKDLNKLVSGRYIHRRIVGGMKGYLDLR